MSDGRRLVKERLVVGDVMFYVPALQAVAAAFFNAALRYHSEEEAFTFSLSTTRSGPWEILKARRVPYESAARLAKELGLLPESNVDVPLSWSKYCPLTTIIDDGSQEAGRLIAAFVRAGVPFRLEKALKPMPPEYWENMKNCLQDVVKTYLGKK